MLSHCWEARYQLVDELSEWEMGRQWLQLGSMPRAWLFSLPEYFVLFVIQYVLYCTVLLVLKSQQLLLSFSIA